MCSRGPSCVEGCVPLNVEWMLARADGRTASSRDGLIRTLGSSLRACILRIRCVRRGWVRRGGCCIRRNTLCERGGGLKEEGGGDGVFACEL